MRRTRSHGYAWVHLPGTDAGPNLLKISESAFAPGYGRRQGRSRAAGSALDDERQKRSRPAGRIQDFGARDFENKQRSAVYHGLSGTKRDRLILKGFLHCGMVHEFIENRTQIPLKSLAIPAERA
jgi:hypothetical protein